MGLYDKQAQTAYKQIRAKGKLVQLVVPGVTVAADPDRPLRVVENPSAETRIGVYAVFQGFQTERVDGSEILRGDEKAFLSAMDADGAPLTVLPTMNQFVDRGDQGVWSIENVVPVRPNDENILFECQIRLTSRRP